MHTEGHHVQQPTIHIFLASLLIGLFPPGGALAQPAPTPANQVLEWNQIFIDTLIATSTPNASSQRLGAIVHTAIFDAYDGIERRSTPIFVDPAAPQDASPQAAVIAAAYTALVELFPAQQSELDAKYAASLETLSDSCACPKRIERGIDWGTEVGLAVLAWRATDGYGDSYPAFTGGSAVGQWRPTPPASGPMSAQGLAFTSTFILDSNSQFRPAPPRTLGSATYAADFNVVKDLGQRTGSTRTEDQSALALFWDGNASVHWNQAANQMARSSQLSMFDTSRLLAVLNVAMADTAFTIWSGKRYYGGVANDVTWRPVSSIPLADTDGNSDTTSDPNWLPLIATPSHPEYPAGHPSQNGAAATVLLNQFGRGAQSFTLSTPGLPDRTYESIDQARADGNNARIWGGMHYPSTVAISDAIGQAIAEYVDGHAMNLLDPRHLSMSVVGD
jgi:hypothetical protein